MIKLNEQKTCLNKDHCNYQYFLFLYKVILHVYLCVEISTKYSKSFKSHIFPKMYIPYSKVVVSLMLLVKCSCIVYVVYVIACFLLINRVSLLLQMALDRFELSG